VQKENSALSTASKKSPGAARKKSVQASYYLGAESLSTARKQSSSGKVPTPIPMKSMNSSMNHLLVGEAAGDPVNLLIEYGEMLPKEGVKSLPDYKVMAFLRVLTDYRKKLEEEERYLESK